MTRYVRTRPTKEETWSIAAVSVVLAAGVGLATFFVARLFVAREAIPEPGHAGSSDASDR